MINLLCDTLAQRLAQWNVILGMILAMVGIAIACLANRICRWKFKKDEIEPNNPLLILLKTIGLIILVVALILLVIQ